MPKGEKGIVDRVAISIAIVGAVIGLVASFVLSNDAIILAKNSDATLTCSVSAVLNCASVAKSEQAALFGFPNSFIGIAAMSALLAILMVAWAKVRFPLWFNRALAGGIALGLIFAGWMFYESFFVIQVLCPWCLTTDLGMLLIIFGVFRYLARLDDGTFPSKVAKFSRNGYDLFIVIAAVVLIAASILLKYGSSLLG